MLLIFIANIYIYVYNYRIFYELIRNASSFQMLQWFEFSKIYCKSVQTALWKKLCSWETLVMRDGLFNSSQNPASKPHHKLGGKGLKFDLYFYLRRIIIYPGKCIASTNYGLTRCWRGYQSVVSTGLVHVNYNNSK